MLVYTIVLINLRCVVAVTTVRSPYVTRSFPANDIFLNNCSLFLFPTTYAECYIKRIYMKPSARTVQKIALPQIVRRPRLPRLSRTPQ